MRRLVAFRAEGSDVRVTHVVAENDDEAGKPRGRSGIAVPATVAAAVLCHEDRSQELQQPERDDHSGGSYHRCIPIAVDIGVPDGSDLKRSQDHLIARTTYATI